MISNYNNRTIFRNIFYLAKSMGYYQMMKR